MKHKTYKGFKYMVLQMTLGHLCGYVQVPKGHPYYGKDYEAMNIDCHGGLTYSSMSDGKPYKMTEIDYSKYFTKGFWIGFDYAHSGDWSFYHADSEFNKKYNTMTQPFEVEKECMHVIDQLVKIKK